MAHSAYHSTFLFTSISLSACPQYFSNTTGKGQLLGLKSWLLNDNQHRTPRCYFQFRHKLGRTHLLPSWVLIPDFYFAYFIIRETLLWRWWWGIVIVPQKFLVDFWFYWALRLLDLLFLYQFTVFLLPLSPSTAPNRWDILSWSKKTYEAQHLHHKTCFCVRDPMSERKTVALS